MKKRVILVLLALLLLVTAAVFSIQAAETDYVAQGIRVAEAADKLVFPADKTAGTAVCPVCEKSVSWQPLTVETVSGGITLAQGGHYYLAEDITADKACLSSPTAKTACVHLNGKKLTSKTNQALYGSSGILNVMGDGQVQGGAATAKHGATVQINTAGFTGEVRLYGGTYGKYAPASAAAVVAVQSNGGIISLFSDAKIVSGTAGQAVHLSGGLNYTDAVFNLYGGTIDASDSTTAGAVYLEAPADLVSSHGDQKGRAVSEVFYMYAGTVKNGKAANGGNVFVGANAVFHFIGGTVENGTASTSGGNVYLDGAMNMSGGSITGSRDQSGTALGGAASSTGGGVCVSAKGTFNMTGGSITGCTATYGGNLYAAGAVRLENALLTEGKATSHGGNVSCQGGNIYICGNTRLENGIGSMGGNIRIWGGTVIMVSGTITGGTSTTGKTQRNMWLQGDSATKSAFYFLGGTIDGVNGVDGSGITCGQSGMLYLGGDAAVVGACAGIYMTHAQAKLYVCDGWSGSANIKFTSNYAVGSTLPVATAEVITLGNDLVTQTSGGDFNGLLIQRNTTVAGLCPTEGGALTVAGAVLVSANGDRKATTDPLADWLAGKYAYIQLCGEDNSFDDLDGKTVYVDLNGFDLSVGGAGTLYAFDSQNDTYDASRCGVVTNTGAVEVAKQVAAPNGKLYVALPNGNGTTFHRFEGRITDVALRTSQAGMYYRAVYECDTALAAAVKSYGVVLSIEDMPGADFAQADDIEYTVMNTPFQSGVTALSGTVLDILQESNTTEENRANGQTPIYATPYICIDAGEEQMVTGDYANAGKSVENGDFSGIAYSLRDVLELLDAVYYTYPEQTRQQLDGFYRAWKDQGMDWQDFVNIGSGASRVDNSNLKFDDGTTNALCPVCNKKVTWTALTSEKMVVLKNGEHYYLDKDLTHTGTDTTFVYAPQTVNHKACLHLNGHNITATKTKAIYGSSGILNVMGNGVVTGYTGTANMGAAVQINNGYSTAAIHLYGGTYRKGTSPSTASVVTVWNAGGNIHMYEGATVENTAGVSTYVSHAQLNNGVLGIHGAKVTGGTMMMKGASAQYGKQTTLQITGGQIDAVVEVPENNRLILSGAPKIKQINMADSIRADISDLKLGAQIGISASGIFTQESDNAIRCASGFTSMEEGKQIILRSKTLACSKDYTGDLEFTGAQQAYCPVCEKTATWTAVDGSLAVTMTKGGHYYLPKNVTWEGTANFLTAPVSGDACLHLNGNDLTATAATAIVGNAGTLNVMGDGTVKGSATKSGYGAAVQVNVTSAAGTVNLYSGTYDQADGASTSSYTLSLLYHGGKLHVFDDVKVRAAVSGRAIYTGVAYSADQHLGIQGANITGTVYLDGADETRGFASSVTVQDGSIDGKFSVTGVNTVTLSGAPKLSQLDVTYPNKVVLDKMAAGADITVSAQGRFTEETENASSWKQYFKSNNRQGSIQVENNRLACNVDYVSALQFKDGNIAFCPVCNKDVAWTAVTGEKLNLQNGDHYYLNKSIVYEGDGDKVYSFVGSPSTQNHKACLHLNGYDLTATKLIAIYGSGGITNVMGTGNVTGCSKKVGVGAAVQINNGWPNATVNLYGGNYKVGADSVSNAVAVAVWNNGGTINVYKGATLNGGAYLGSANNTNDGKLALYGATVNGNVTLVGADQTKGNTATFLMEDGKITGTLNAKVNNQVTLAGKLTVGKLTVQAGQIINLRELVAGTKISVSAEGTFTNQLADKTWLDYFATTDAGDWLVIRDNALTQSALLNTTASEADIAQLENLYTGREPLHGEFHDHASTGGVKSDGKATLDQWKTAMAQKDMDFTTIVDHKQMFHMELPEWDESMFIGGSEPGTTVLDMPAGTGSMHYNMVFATAEEFDKFLTENNEKFNFRYNIGGDGYFFYDYYNSYTRQQLMELAEAVRTYGGFFNHNHPMGASYLKSDDPLDYWFGDYTGFEVLEGYYTNMNDYRNVKAYNFWEQMLQMGKKVYATAGSDSHQLSKTVSLSTIYSAERHASAYLEQFRAGNFTAGPAGIRMSIGDTPTGGECDFTGKRLVVAVGDIHSQEYKAGHTYQIKVYDEKGLVCTKDFTGTDTAYLAIDAQDCMYYRADLYDVTDDLIVAVGNPIWNTQS